MSCGVCGNSNLYPDGQCGSCGWSDPELNLARASGSSFSAVEAIYKSRQPGQAAMTKMHRLEAEVEDYRLALEDIASTGRSNVWSGYCCDVAEEVLTKYNLPRCSPQHIRGHFTPNSTDI